MEKHAFALLQQMEHSWWYRGRAAAIAAALSRARRSPTGAVLDYGAGYGGMYDSLARFGSSVYALEIDAEARRAAAARGYAKVFASLEEAYARQYALIAAFDVVEHINDDRAFLTRTREVLSPGGKLVITVPAFTFLWSEHDVTHHHFRRYTKKSLRACLEEAGYTIDFISYWNCLLFLPAALLRLAGKSGESGLALPRVINSFFFFVVSVEAVLMRYVSLLWGTGIVAVARKR